MIINIFGPQLETEYQVSLTDIARTSVGNLANSLKPTSEGQAAAGVWFPFCTGDGNIYETDCKLDKAALGNLYTWLDIGGIFFLMIAIWWLNYFEDIEENDINKLTLFVSSYTVKVARNSQ